MLRREGADQRSLPQGLIYAERFIFLSSKQAILQLPALRRPLEASSGPPFFIHRVRGAPGPGPGASAAWEDRVLDRGALDSSEFSPCVANRGALAMRSAAASVSFPTASGTRHLASCGSSFSHRPAAETRLTHSCSRCRAHRRSPWLSCCSRLV